MNRIVIVAAALFAAPPAAAPAARPMHHGGHLAHRTSSHHPRANRGSTSHSIWIDKAHQRLYAFSGHHLVLAAKCSTAGNKMEWVPGDHRKESSETPSGDFKVIKKDSDHYSNSYQVHMLYAVFFSPGRAIHGTYPSVYDRLGSAASGGCIRLTRGRAAVLYSWARVGDPIHIVHTIPAAVAQLVHRAASRAALIHQARKT